MPYNILFNVDGGCRNNGYSNAIGAAAAVRHLPNRRYKAWYYKIWNGCMSQRAELIAIIMALDLALKAYYKFGINDDLDLVIRSDSQYAVNCMTNWIYTWLNNGWLTSSRRNVVNRDLVEIAYTLHSEASELGSLRYEYVPRAQNSLADRYCNKALDEMM